MKNKKWKADEMEMTINFKAMRVAFVFSIIALLAYCIYEAVVSKNLPTVPFVILTVQSAVFFISKLFLTKEMSEGANDEE